MTPGPAVALDSAVAAGPGAAGRLRAAARAAGQVGAWTLAVALTMTPPSQAQAQASAPGTAAASAPAAVGAAPAAAQPTDPRDPLEKLNRGIFGFNEAVDRAALRPAAELYQRVLPHWLRQGVDNMFYNLGDVWSGVNLLLQGKLQRALETTIRVGTNTLFGVGGFFDVADDLGLERGAQEDFGQTLGFWGIPTGPYLVLPLLGPSDLRDSAGLVADMKAAGTDRVFAEPADRNAARALQVLNTRVRLLGAGQVLDGIALDKYTLYRDAYLSRRRNLVHDGNPPDDDAPAASPAAASAPAGK